MEANERLYQASLPAELEACGPCMLVLSHLQWRMESVVEQCAGRIGPEPTLAADMLAGTVWTSEISPERMRKNLEEINYRYLIGEVSK